ncbi:mucin-like glycoprotein [Trypanosoma conorhini]|uniref:Mucin-like glycoprotein n=1 Tax=Trypanosoma conorhini TaxID=83891 RepID=A0A3R7N8E3_9TRYP|nr:mucin-like glycoprotein [Trypanosoma conorhini]RNE98416.1 mucin-like glycoprotein [Trypanosoma conorhini]
MAMTTLAVRIRAVCALALLALLCGCGCGATGDVNVSVEVSCPNDAKKLRWRVAGEKSPTWKECPQAVMGAESIESAAAAGHTLCFVAGSVYLGGLSTGTCPASTTDGGTNEVVAFKLACTAAANSALYNLSRSADDTVTLNAAEDPLGASGFCDLPTSSQPTTQAQAGPQQTPGQHQPAGPPQQKPANAATASPSAQIHDGDRARNGGSTATVGGQPGSAVGSTGSQEQSAEGPQKTPTPSVGTAAPPAQTTNGAADAPGGTQTPSNPQGRSATPNATTPASDNDGAATTTATTRSSSDGNNAKSNADGSAINSNTTQKAVANASDSGATSSSFVRAPLMLLLTAALACAAAAG